MINLLARLTCLVSVRIVRKFSLARPSPRKALFKLKVRRALSSEGTFSVQRMSKMKLRSLSPVASITLSLF